MRVLVVDGAPIGSSLQLADADLVLDIGAQDGARVLKWREGPTSDVAIEVLRPELSNGVRPVELELRAPQRARFSLTTDDGGDPKVLLGWLRLDASWAHFVSDDNPGDGWESWPASAVNWIEWFGA